MGVYPKTTARILLLLGTAVFSQQGISAKGPGPHSRNPGYVNQNGYLSDNVYGVKNLAFYGDWDSNRVFVVVVDVDSMQLMTTVEGTGEGPYGIDQQTVIDTLAHRKIKDVVVANSASPDYKSQAHTSGVSLDMKYFYSAASHDGVFFEIDLDTLEVSRTLYLGGNVLMGSFIWDGEGMNM